MPVFDGDPHARAKDRDRDRATYVIDAALRNGQITQQDRDLRIERVRSSSTIGDLATLTRDVAAPPASVPPTAVVPPPPMADPNAPASTRPVAGVPADLYGPPPSTRTTVASGTGPTVKSSTGRKAALGCSLIAALFLIVPIAVGVVLFASSSQDGGFSVDPAEPVPAGPPFELSGAGIREYVAAFDETFDDTEVVRSVFHEGYVVSWVPEADGQVSLWNYADGSFDQLGDPMADTEDAEPVDLAELRPGRVMALVRETETFAMTGALTTFVIYDRHVIDGTPQVMVYVTSDEGQSGYVIGDLDGNVLTRSEPS